MSKSLPAPIWALVGILGVLIAIVGTLAGAGFWTLVGAALFVGAGSALTDGVPS